LTNLCMETYTFNFVVKYIFTSRRSTSKLLQRVVGPPGAELLEPEGKGHGRARKNPAREVFFYATPETLKWDF